MLLVQQNYSKGYKCTISALKAGLGFNTAIVYIQKPFLRNRSISHSRFNLYWPSRTENQKDMRVLTIVRKDILNKIIIDSQTDLVGHLYYSILDIKKLHPLLRKVLKKTRVVNLYENKVGKKQMWQKSNSII